MIAELTGFFIATQPMNDEQALIRSAQRGDLEAFNGLVLRYQQQVYNVGYRIMGDEAAASDVTQEAFISAYRHIGSFHQGSFKNWLLRIVRNACYDELRRRKRRPMVSLDEAVITAEGVIEFDLPASADGPEQIVQRRELADLLQRGINTLPIDQRLTLVLSDVQGLRYDEIAEITHSKRGTVKSRLSRARATLREYVQIHREAVWST
jgi:RNA polymerase sigma-70 factor (ECF subfamily)